MRIRIICYENPEKWILGKFAIQLKENLLLLGHEVDIKDKPNKLADINHHIIYSGYGSIVSTIDTLMITHIDNTNKLNLLKKQLQNAKMGICMSRDTMVKLHTLGIPRSKLCYINPAHDGIIKPNPIIIGITCRVQPDGRKREFMLGELAKKLNPKEFSFKIMGENWNPYVTKLRNFGFEVDYFDDFELAKYTELIPNLDYYLYFGQDEGQMGVIDALASGVKTIATPQGFHLDTINGISHPFQTMGDLLDVFETIAEEKRSLISSVSSWNWKDYSIKHLNIWEHLITSNHSKINKSINRTFSDGMMSLEEFDQENLKISILKKLSLLAYLFKERFRHSFYSRLNQYRNESK